jgi:hypothetical protein
MLSSGVWLSQNVDMKNPTVTFVSLTPCFREIAVVKPEIPEDARLTGAAMRKHLFFATVPGNANLYISEKKAGII